MEVLLVLRSQGSAKQHLVYSIFVECNVVYVALAKGIRLFLYTSHKLSHTNSREVLQNAGCQHTCPRDHSIRAYTQAASAARAMLTIHIFLTARRGINTTGGSNKHKLH